MTSGRWFRGLVETNRKYGHPEESYGDQRAPDRRPLACLPKCRPLGSVVNYHASILVPFRGDIGTERDLGCTLYITVMPMLGKSA